MLPSEWSRRVHHWSFWKLVLLQITHASTSFEQICVSVALGFAPIPPRPTKRSSVTKKFFFRKVIVKIWLLNIPILLYTLVWWSCFDSSNLHKIIGIICHGQNLYFLQNVENGKMELIILPVVTWAALTSCSTPPSSLEQRHRRGLHRPWRQQLVSWWKKTVIELSLCCYIICTYLWGHFQTIKVILNPFVKFYINKE